MAKSPRKLRPVEERLWAKVQKTETCWLWTGTRNPDGYGSTSVGRGTDGTRQLVGVHRLAYELTVGPIPAGMTIDHLCRVRHCVNPAHLEAVTKRENSLRGVGFAAKNARKTHCPKGHPYDEANTQRRRDGGRVCRICRLEQKRTDSRRRWRRSRP